jgi:hypothetical protein
MSNTQDQSIADLAHRLAAYLQSADGQTAVVGLGVAIVMALAVAVVLSGARRRRQSRDEMRDMRSVAENQFAEIKGRLTAMAEVRYPVYAEAHLTVDSGSGAHAEAVEAIVKALKTLNVPVGPAPSREAAR